MQIRYLLLAILCYSQLSFPMHVVPYVSTTYAKRLVQLPKRTMHNAFGCTCIKNFKPEIGGDDTIRKENIEHRIAKFNWAQEIVEHKEQLQAENLWPKKEGDVLEKELSSAKYCKKFKRCAGVVENKASIFEASFLIPMAMAYACYLPRFNEGVLAFLTVSIGSLYFLPSIVAHKKILSNIAYQDMLHFYLVCYSFEKARLALCDRKKEQEKKQELEDQNNKE